MGGTIVGRNFDIFASISGLTSDSFRDQSHEDVKRGYINLGFRHSDSAETRLHLIANDNRLELPGSLRKAQLIADPTRTSGSASRDLGIGTFGDQLFDWEAHDASRNLERYRSELQHSILLSDSGKLGIGAWYENRDLDHPLPFVIIDSESNEAGLSFRYENQARLFNNDNQVIVGGLYAWGQSNGKNFNTIFGGGDAVKNGLRSRTTDEPYTLEWFAEDQYSVTSDLDLIVGGQMVHAKRREIENFVAPATTDTKNSKSYTGFSPKLGLIWKATDTVHIFGNASRNYEPPTTIEFGAGVAASQGKLDAQESIVLEIGTRGAFGMFDWDLAFYHAWLNDEILLREDPTSPGQSIAQNADETRHMGVEIGLNAVVPLGLLGDDNLSLRSVYTYNNFEFDGDPAFGNNKLPGIPENLATIEVLYNHPSGFYAGPNVQYADNYFVDYANTQKADAYTIYGVRAGFEFAEKYTIFFEGRNLADRKWIANTGIGLNSMGGDPRQFNPGYDRNFFFGFSADLI